MFLVMYVRANKENRSVSPHCYLAVCQEHHIIQ